MRAIALALATLLGGALSSGCGGGCEIGSTWCEDDYVMVCVHDPDAVDDDWDDDDDDTLLEVILAFIELADDDTRAEVLEDCWQQGKSCIERTDERDDPFAECGFGGW